MRQLKKSECAILPLVLKKKWYDLIDSGEKKEEYRDAKPFWNKRINKWRSQQSSSWDDLAKSKKLVIGFSCGYKKPDMFFLAHRTIIEDYSNHPEWGEPAGHHYVIELGERVEIIATTASVRRTTTEAEIK